ncbi:hypothetical protein [Streptomyces sp. NPDC052015]|uniref:hypothetical protein n=1 Tax=Streptomyces sp. NPDC052015 TaxID=3154755 RepID=UPI0034149AA4
MFRVGPAFHLSCREVRLRTILRRGWWAVTALLGLALLLVSGAALAAVPSFLEDERAFRAAVPCHAGAASDGCLRMVVASVRGTVIRDEVKIPTYVLRLSGPQSVPREVDTGGAEPLLEDLRKGALAFPCLTVPRRQPAPERIA